MTENVFDADALIVGAGMGGLTAASYLASRGRTVLVVEKGAEVGGTAAVSGGVLWTAPSVEDWRERCPRGDEALGEALIDGFPSLMHWLRELGVEIEDRPVTVHDFAQGHPFDVLGYFARVTRLVESNGGWVLRSTKTVRVLEDHGVVVGAVVRDEHDTEVRVRCPAVVLATGGFQGSPEARAQFIHPNAAGAAVRANPNSVGDGLRLATSVGADVSAESDGFYGHLMCAPLGQFEGEDFTRLYMHFSHLTVMLNLDGERFTDERAGDHLNAQSLVRQRDARGVLIFDDPVYRSAVLAPNVEGFQPYDKLQLARDRGANVATATSLEMLAHAVAEWGFDAVGVFSALQEHNRGDASPPDPGHPLRTDESPPPVDEPPFHAIEVQPGITFGHSGLRIDTDARVLDIQGSPIRGLYACGADVGGVYDHGYCGGLALAGVFGLVAAQHVDRRDW